MKLPSVYTKDKKIINVIIETPAQSRNKFVYDHDTGSFKLSKVLPAGLCFPCDFGFIPHTKAGDGDPVDVLLIMDTLTYPGCIVECRLVGIIKGTQQEGRSKPFRNDRIIAIPVEMKDLDHIRQTMDIGKHKIDAVIKFIEFYNHMEGKVYKLLEVGDAESAYKQVRKSIVKK